MRAISATETEELCRDSLRRQQPDAATRSNGKLCKRKSQQRIHRMCRMDRMMWKHKLAVLWIFQILSFIAVLVIPDSIAGIAEEVGG